MLTLSALAAKNETQARLLLPPQREPNLLHEKSLDQRLAEQVQRPRQRASLGTAFAFSKHFTISG
jgi:hypothetical protein